MAILKMQLNIPVVVQQAKYLDVMPPGQYGAQLRLKGTINGDADAMLYLPGKVWANRKALQDAGVLGPEAFDEEPTEALGLHLLKKTFKLVNQQVQGKTYGQLVVTAPEEVPGGPPSQSPPPDQLAPQETAKTQHGPTVEQLQRCYLDCLRWSLDTVAPMLAKAPDVGATPEAVVSAAATLFIARTRRA